MVIHVETFIRAELENVWRHTQSPDLHQRWDLRFTRIQYLPRPDPSAPQRFLYETRIGVGLRIQGEGESVVTRDGPGGVRTSSLRFWSHDAKSLIREGSGYWQYVPEPGGVRFLTRYSYATRFGAVGKLLNALFFEPLMGWATAWSFDRLRLWLEAGLDPSATAERGATQALARLGLATAWIYQGLVPKLLYPESGELAILRQARFVPGREAFALRAAGLGEMAIGAAFLAFPRARALFPLNALLLLGLGAGALRTPTLFRMPFNPISLTVSMLALSAIGFRTSGQVPEANRCRWSVGKRARA